MEVSLDHLLETCKKAAQVGGQQLLDWRSRFDARLKAPNDWVTDADLASQRAIHDCLVEAYPDHGFLGEEDLDLPMLGNQDSDFRWIVDPLDGTLNYVHDLPSYSVSIALQHKGKIVVGAVFDPWLDEMYSAHANGPAKLNDRQIQVSGCQQLSQALSVVSLPSKVTKQSPEFEDFQKILFQARSVRRLGSAALNFCYVAAGRLDFYWATTVKVWDIAAGYLILNRSGGCTTGADGGALDLQQPKFVAAASQPLNQEVVKLLRDE